MKVSDGLEKSGCTARSTGRHYSGLKMASLVYPGKDHYSVWEPTLNDGVCRFLAKI